MKIVVSIPVHEEKEVILDQIYNIQHYIGYPVIVLHIVKSFYENECFREFENREQNGIYINPEHLEAKWGNIAHLHLSNFRYIKSVIDDFDYYLMHASNDLYVRKGIEGYIRLYKAGFNRRILSYPKSMWWPCEYAHRDKVLKRLMYENGISQIVGTQVEGSFYRKDLFEQIDLCIGSIDLFEGDFYPKEEIYFSTIAYKLLREDEIGYPTTFSEVHRYDSILWKIELILNKIWKMLILPPDKWQKNIFRHIKHIYTISNFYTINKKIINKICSNDMRYINRYSLMNDHPGKFRLYDGNLYSVKRIKRKIDNPQRQYIRNITNSNQGEKRALSEKSNNI